MVSPVPKHLRTQQEIDLIDSKLINHIEDICPDASRGVQIARTSSHRAKYAPGLATELVKLANSINIGDPFAGTGTIAYETGIPVALNDLDISMTRFLDPLIDMGCEVTYQPANSIQWKRDVCIFSPPYYPRTDRKRPNAHNDAKRGPIVGFRDSYNCDHPDFIGNPGGVNAILSYRQSMTSVYKHLGTVCSKMIIVTKNWTRLGVELRLDLDTILMCQETGWKCTGRHGWRPKPSLWSRYNSARNTGVEIEDILIFERLGIKSSTISA